MEFIYHFNFERQNHLKKLLYLFCTLSKLLDIPNHTLKNSDDWVCIMRNLMTCKMNRARLPALKKSSFHHMHITIWDWQFQSILPSSHSCYFPKTNMDFKMLTYFFTFFQCFQLSEGYSKSIQFTGYNVHGHSTNLNWKYKFYKQKDKQLLNHCLISLKSMFF